MAHKISYHVHPRCSCQLIWTKPSSRLDSNRSIRKYSTDSKIRSILEETAKKNNIRNTTDWYQVDYRNLDTKASEIIKKQFDGSIYRALRSAYPETEWYPWKFPEERIPRDYWSEPSNQRKFFDDLGKKIGIQTLDDWYEKLSLVIMEEHGGKAIQRYHSSITAAIMAAYPKHNWIPWKFNNTQIGFWKSEEHQRQYFEWLGKELGVKKLDDWYQKLSYHSVERNGGRALLMRHKDSPAAALMAAFPEHNWIPWMFNILPTGYWNSMENQKKFFEWLGNKLDITTLDDWYGKLSSEVVHENGGTSLLYRYKNSPTAALLAVYPDHEWIPWKFNSVPKSFWRIHENQRKFFDYLGKKAEIQSLDDWYEKLSLDLIIQHGGRGLVVIPQHKNSPAIALMAAYPEHKWFIWKFKNPPKGTWQAENNIKAYLAELSEKLSIQNLDDWYRVDTLQLKKFGATTLLFNKRGLYNLLREQYPHHPWDVRRFRQFGKKGQRWLAVTLKKLFPDEEILEDYVHPKAAFQSSNRSMQLDVFIPSKSLAFEYQGEQHYDEVGVFSPSKIYQQRDEEKRVLCAANNIKLIEVPYWWNRTQESLQEMINTHQLQ